MRKIFKELVTVDKARTIFYNSIDMEIKGQEIVSLKDCLGKVLAQDINAPIDVPPFDRASMDGYAVRTNDLIGVNEDHAIKLNCIGSIGAGYVFDGEVKPGECVEVSTGAPLPLGADAVVMVEYTHREQKQVEFFQAVTPTTNIMYTGTDMKRGSRVLSKYTFISSRELAILAALGFSKIPVIQELRIGIYSSGDEIIEPGEKLEPGKLYDINANAVRAALEEENLHPEYQGIIPDNYQGIEKSIRNAIETYDLIILSGGTSAGKGDLLYQVIEDIGNPGLLVHGIKVKPGKPTILASCNGSTIIGLPGFPFSALSIFHLFVLPYVRLKMGKSPSTPTDKVKGRTLQRLRSVMGRHEFKPVNLISIGNQLIVYPVPGGSGAITSIAKADGFIEIPDNQEYIAENTMVDVSLISKNIVLPDLQLVGPHHPALDQLMQEFMSKQSFTIRYIRSSGSAGVAAVRRGDAHIGLINVLNKHGVYNSWVLETFDAELISGFTRPVGLVVNHGNPLQVFGIKDLTSVKFANHKVGSSLRYLLDLLIEKTGIETSSINGYDLLVNTDMQKEMLRDGRIDAYFGYAPDEEYDFIQIREESFDFLVTKHKDPALKVFVEYLKEINQIHLEEVN